VSVYYADALCALDVPALRHPTCPDEVDLPAGYTRTSGEWVKTTANNHNRTGVQGLHLNGKNPGDVWSIPTTPFPGAHFAVMAPAVADRCIKAGCKPRFCRECGHTPAPIVEKGGIVSSGSSEKVKVTQTGAGHIGIQADGRKFDSGDLPRRERTTTGYTDCGHNAYTAGVVLDPFSGSGTTGLAAARLGRRYVGIDLNAGYLSDSLKTRLQQPALIEEDTA
jgi:hypothetical protein